ncbi:MAG TPA: response regulator transcription factor [Alphaproteobacteria bacterium]|jgi:two-component system OmpR family response regulator|nr:response regulator transcription factor [Alphaproteobacteria bacterium]
MHILLIEDDDKTAQYIRENVTAQGHLVDWTVHGAEGLNRALQSSYDVLIVDRMLPGMDGLEIIRRLREAKKQTPILVLSALSLVDDRVAGLRSGGDDYLTKPFAISELLARLEVLGKRGQQHVVTTFVIDNLTIDLLNRKVVRGNKLIDLLPREFSLLEFLAKHQGQVVTRSMLLETVWGYHFDPQTNIVDVHVSRLRQKIDKDFSPALIHTVRGVGYMISVISLAQVHG